MKDFLVSARDSAIVAGALILIGTVKITTTILGIILATVTLLVITVLAIMLVIRDLIISIKGE